jgi:hypothetical protein
MKHWKNLLLVLTILIVVHFLSGCNTGQNENIKDSGREPVIDPDFSGVTIPVNIAPLNFVIKEEGRSFRVKASSSNGSQLSVSSTGGIVNFSLRPWKKLLEGMQGRKITVDISSVDKDGNVTKFNPVYINVANEPIDPYLCYRLLYPGYETYFQLKIVQRNITGFSEKSLVENQLLQNNCINCHSFNRNNPEKFLLHVRGSSGGTYFVDGEKITRRDLKTKEMNSGAVYPSWHPGGRYVAFSSNNIVQSFHASPEENIEVTDLSSSIVLYDTERNEISPVEGKDTAKYMETFPEWSPDGKYLYYCRAKQYKEGDSIKNIRYDLVRRSFNKDSLLSGKPEIVFDANAIKKSVSFPRISPDGRYLVFTLHNYGNFSIWHKEADLYLIDIQTGKVGKMTLNSNEAESWHCWSSNSKWLVFSSKRGDGLTARPYFAYIASPDSMGKPFVLPKKDPGLYSRMVLTFNRPELITGKINLSTRDFEQASKEEAVKAVWAGKK